MTNKQFFQEALLEAKTIRETALASAKASLEEAFTPRIKSMIDAKLSLMEDDASDDNEIDETKEMDEAKAKADEAKKVEEKKDMDEAKDMEENKDMEEAKAKQEEGYGMDEANELDEMELDEILAELERDDANEGVAPAGVPVNPLNLEAKVKADEAKKVEEKKEDVKEGEAAYEYEKGKQAGEKLGEEAEAEDEVTELTVDELKDLIRDVLADVLGSDAAAEDEIGADEEEVTVNDSEEVSDDMELETILRELDKKVEGKVDEKKDVDEAKKVEEKKVEEKKDVDEAKKEVEEAKKEVDEAVKVIKALKNELNEVNLLNAKLLYVNKIFKSKSLTESQKVKVINAFDRAESVKEVKNTYETLKESFNGASQKSAIKESVGFASKTVLGGSTTSAPIVETDSFVARMQKLAGIK
jgi:hypothetical protein